MGNGRVTNSLLEQLPEIVREGRKQRTGRRIWARKARPTGPTG